MSSTTLGTSVHYRRAAMLLATLLTLLLMATDSPAQEPGEIRVSVLTCGPGREIYQLEGHSALRLTRAEVVRDSVVVRNGYDEVVNWGVFDFAAPNFVYRFVKGQTDYMALAYPFELFLEEYRREGRRVVEQVIDLTPQQAERLEALASHNIQPENRTYRYNYVKDNCATRPLAMIEAAIGDTLAFRQPDNMEPATFRSEMQRYHRNYPWYQFGIDLALGSGIDKPISLRERTFAPVDLERQLATATYRAADGTSRPVVKETNLLNHGITGGVTAEATPRMLSPMGVATALAIVVALFSIHDVRRRRSSKWLDSALYGVSFLAGCIVTFLVFASSHEATSPNWLLLWLNPLCIIPAAGVWIKRCERAVYCYQICNFAALILLMAGHRFFGQAINAAFPLLILCNMMRSLTFIYVYRATSRNISGNK